MSKQATANHIYLEKDLNGWTRQETIDMIADAIDGSTGYASTLYNKAHKAATRNIVTKIPKAKPVMKSGNLTSFTRGNLNGMRQDINAALADVAAKHGITLDIGSISFSDNQFTTKITAKTGDGSDAARDVWEAYSHRHGFTMNEFGQTFTTNGTEYRITGYKPKGKKFNIAGVRVSDGAGYKFSIAQVRNALRGA